MPGMYTGHFYWMAICSLIGGCVCEDLKACEMEDSNLARHIVGIIGVDKFGSE